MLINEIKTTTSQASKFEILTHLQTCDIQFTPLLSSRVKLDEFAQKIHNLTITFEAWHNNILIGLLGCYYTDTVNKRGFITHVSVLAAYSNHGIATKLLDQCITYGKKNGFKYIDLEVNMNNQVAIGLYQKHHFAKTGMRHDYIVMRMKIRRVD